MQIPTATYRVQFNPSFGFKDVAEIVNYLANLGVSHLYASPIFKARRNSSHGYDGADPNQLNPQLGTSAEFETLIDVLQGHGMGWLQDIAPNHMAFDYDNRMLMDVLENGPHSAFYRFFDIEWHHPDQGLRMRLLAPFLGSRYAECLIAGEIQLRYGETGFTVEYYDRKLPLRIESYLNILGYGIEKVKITLGENQPDYICLIDILDNLESLSLPVEAGSRTDQIRLIKESLWNIYCTNDVIKQFIDRNTRLFNGQRGEVASFGLLDTILSRQHFRLCYWQVACDEINYRRFFDINELIALCQEKEEVFDGTHLLLSRFVEDGIVAGIRIDHIDGLADPAGYLNRLRRRFKDLYILVEKILDPAEKLPGFWPIQGTTGYEFTTMLNALFVRLKNKERFTTVYTRFSGREESFESVVYSGKRRILETQMSGELDNLAFNVKKVSSGTPAGRDFTLKRLRASLTELLVRFPVYRTYIANGKPRDSDRQYIRAAVESSVLRRPDLKPELLFLKRLLLGELGGGTEDEENEITTLQHLVATRFQQLTAPLMAKGFEDTSLYVYNCLLSLNEVGGDPRQFGCEPSDFHAFVQQRANHWPHAMNNTATHDSKRGEDVRARLNVLSEIPAEWAANLEQWQALNRPLKARLDGREVPDKNEEYFLYQTLVGAFPLGDYDLADFIDRLGKYMVKAVREAKIHTSWLSPNEAHEAALTAFVERILAPSGENSFLDTILPFCKKIARYGIYNSLSQTMIKITAPGVPDIYQGTELMDLNLVDPDNRRAVDFVNRLKYLQKIKTGARIEIRSLIDELMADRFDGRLKLYVMAAALKTRNAYSRLYRDGSYVALQTTGRFHNHVVAFARHDGYNWSISTVPRLLTDLVGEDEDPMGSAVWQDTAIELPAGTPVRWHNALTDEVLTAKNTLALGDLLALFPAALLIGE